MKTFTDFKNTGSTLLKVSIGFIAGAITVGGVASAAGLFSSTTSIVCADSRGVLYAPTSGNCVSGRQTIGIASSTTGNNIEGIVKVVSPSVVTVNVTTSQGGDTGSGSVIQSDASKSYILTNNHVIDAAMNGAGTIQIEMDNGDQYDATIVGRDVNYDLAVLQVKKGNLPVIQIGDSSALQIGDSVLAFGSPLGLNGTVTSNRLRAQSSCYDKRIFFWSYILCRCDPDGCSY